MVHNNNYLMYKVKISNYTACNVKTIKTLRGSSQKGKLRSLYLGRGNAEFNYSYSDKY